MLPCKCDHLLNLGDSDIIGINPADSSTVYMNFEHNLCCLFSVHGKKSLQHSYHEIHRREIIIQQYHFKHGWR